ncbi:hypothetical protein Tco_0415303 [Tanacetum coccineum]
MKGITINEYLAMEDKKMAKQCMNSSFEKLWYLADEDDEEETYLFDMNEFLAIQIHSNVSSKSAGTDESLYSTLDENYDAIEYTFEEEYKIESEVFDLLKIDLDLFTYDTPLGIIFDEFRRLSSMCSDEYERMFAEVVILIDNRLVKLIDIILDQWLDLKFRNHKKVYKEIMEGVVATWLIRNYRKQLEEYMEIKRRLEVNGINTNVECDPTNKRGDDEEVLTYDEFSDLEEENMHEGDETVEVFRIETDIFLFETPLCKEFKEFNHLLHIDVDVLTQDLPGFKTYEDYKNTWYYKWNNKVPWVDEKPWLEDRIWKEPTDDIHHECKLFGFKSGHVEWPTCNWRDDGYYNEGDLSRVIREGKMVYFLNYEWYEGLEDGNLKDEDLKEKVILEGSWGHKNRKGMNFCSWLKESFGNYHEIDYELMLKLEEYWWGKKEEEESSEDAWSNYSPNDEWEHHEHVNYIQTDVNSNHDTYNNVCQMFKNRAGINNNNDAIQANQEWFEYHEIMEDDDDIGGLDDYLIPKDEPYHVDEEGE